MSDIVCYVAIPGPAGPAGQNGSDGQNGLNAYTATTAAFNLPAEGGTVAVNVVSSAWAVLGQVVVVQSGGAFAWMEVVSIQNATTLTFQNLENTATSSYLDNSPPGTVFAIGAKVSPGGLQGPAGVDGAGAPTTSEYVILAPEPLLPNAQDLSALSDGILKKNLGGSISIATTAFDYYAPGGIAQVAVVDGGTGGATAGDARTNLGLSIGTDVQAFNALLGVVAALAPTVADRFIYTTGVNTVALATVTAFARDLLDDIDASTMRATLGVSSDMLLFRHQASAGSAGGSFSASGAWIVVPINTEVVDSGNHGSIAGNQITLAAGTYRYRYGVVTYGLDNQFQGRIYNVTAAAAVADSHGQVANSRITNSPVVGVSNGQGRMILGVSTVIQLEAQSASLKLSDGFGIASGVTADPGPEVYSWIELYKE